MPQPWEERVPPEEKKSSIIEQIFDGLKMVSEKELMDTVNLQRKQLQLMVKDEESVDEEGKPLNRFNFDVHARPFFPS